ncbi:hypothetical protein B0T26DRAFT_679728 [Lasiosphaeria miniovina]|uniref:Uncharacterized protein n=1 Tax=Lasiosphaeria miniovina TaxID=1954250 RepID=A0AA39ZYF5_9PEZI|nr:uncharacterized protein B0T26DRAFT_679728 [Lasiosphaeria miniovina]KAK0705971.1 hypothetical protein B0T26DRAFT_679728 [Lasiosphaeria miniovina]
MVSTSSKPAGRAGYRSRWAQVKDPLLDVLQRMYWDGVAREMASALVAFAKICQLHPESLPEETVSTRELVSARLPKLQSLWDPTIGREIQESGNIRYGPSTIRRSRTGVENLGVFERDAPNLTRRVAHAMRIDPREKRARALLQATGLLDVDIASEYRDPVLSCLAPPPQFDALPHVLITRQCSECRWPIRSYSFYECAEGCTDTKGCTSDRAPADADAEAPDASLQRNQFMLLGHSEAGRKAVERSLRQPTPFRLCPACLHNTERPVDHLREVVAFPDTDSDDAKAFARELDAWEDRKRGQTAHGRSLQSVDGAGAVALQRETRTPSRRVFPDGNTHATLMFGPLLIENGASAGALISLRSPPALGVDTAPEMDRYLARDDDLEKVKHGVVVTSVEYKLAEDRALFTRRRSKPRHRLVRCEKQIAGGLFTGHDDTCVDEEDEIVRCFLTRANDWRAVTKSRRPTQKQRLEKLHAFAAEIRDMIRAGFEHRADHYLGTFARRLSDTAIKLNSSLILNNCQMFCNNMVFRNDTDSIYFHRQFPFMMPMGRRDLRLPAYLMSFARDAPHGAVDMANRGIARLGRLQSSMQLHGCMAHNPADAIDHAASVRYKIDAAGRSVWASSSASNTCHDDILLKAPNTTCTTEPRGTGGHACTLADHLLDCPFDNLCVLTLHTHRDMRYYASAPSQDRDGTVQQGRQLTSATAGERREWLANRLRVLHRTYALNTFLAEIVRAYGAMLRDSLPNDGRWLPPLIARMYWEPGSGAEHGRAWWYQKASGPSVYTRNTEDAWPAWTHLKPKERARALELTVVRDGLARDSALRAAWRRVAAAVRRGAATPEAAGSCCCEVCLGIEGEVVCRRALGAEAVAAAAAVAVAASDAPSRDSLKQGVQGLQSWLRSEAGLAADGSGELEDLVRRATELLNNKNKQVGEGRDGRVPAKADTRGGRGIVQTGRLPEEHKTWI